MDKYIGARLGNRYQIGELIGIGGMSNVYKAFDTQLSRIVAVKILRDEYLTNPELLKRFKNESKVITALSSPNIVNVYDVSFNETSQWIVMEYIDGITLKEYIKKKKVLTWQEAAYFAVQVLKALQHAHDKGIIHRDVKPQNIMLLKDGTVKVMDFGIARFARNDTRTMTDKAIGSVHYISPEQAQGGNIDEKADIYSLGVVLFEMVTGRLPFDADNPVSVALKQIQAQPIRPKQLNPMLPTGFDQIIIRAMKKNPRERYQSAAEMLSDLMIIRQNPSKILPYGNGRLANGDLANSIKETGLGKSKVRSRLEAEVNEERVGLQGEKRSSSWVKILMIVSCVFCFLTIAVVAGALFLSGIFSSSVNLEVPNFLGEDYELIKDDPQYSKFDIQLATTEYSEKYAQGEICGQTPRAGREVKENAVITVKVSRGQKGVLMLDVVGKEAQTAASELKNLGVGVKELRVFNDEVEKGLVIKTQPMAGAEVLLGSEVTVYISDGTEGKEIIAPDLNKFRLESAKTMLEELKLELGDVTYANSSEPKDVVLRQNPLAGIKMEPGARVDIQVSSGVPDAKRLTFKISLPKMDETVTLKALLDAESIQEETLDLSEVRQWKVQFAAKGIHRAQILIDDELLKEYIIDFDQVTQTLVEDNTSNFVQ